MIRISNSFTTATEGVPPRILDYFHFLPNCGRCFLFSFFRELNRMIISHIPSKHSFLNPLTVCYLVLLSRYLVSQRDLKKQDIVSPFQEMKCLGNISKTMNVYEVRW